MERPIIHGEALSATQSWEPVEFLVDTGADRTVISGLDLAALGLQEILPRDRIGGLGGLVPSVDVRTQIRLTRVDGGKVLLRGQFPALTDPKALDMSVLGRDILGLFAVSVDQPGGVVCLLRDPHRYTIRRR